MNDEELLTWRQGEEWHPGGCGEGGRAGGTG